MTAQNTPKTKTQLHPRNRNREPYDLDVLVMAIPELQNHLIQNKFGNTSVDFSSPNAVRLLNQALLKHYYGIEYWEFPADNLTPPIPGRADYLHQMADLLARDNSDKIPKGDKITCLDIGTGASCIYPVIGVTEYDWNFVATDIEAQSLASAQSIIAKNTRLQGRIVCRTQPDPDSFFKGVVKEKIDLTICNPPFHATVEEARKGTHRKVKNLTGKLQKNPQTNFEGINNELIYEGGEIRFITTMINESVAFSNDCFWFSTLVSKESNLKPIRSALKNVRAAETVIIPMNTGNKTSRIVAWTFLSKEKRAARMTDRWTKMTTTHT